LRLLSPNGWIFGLFAFALTPVQAAERIGTVTLLEGPAALVRGTTRYAFAEGVRFRPGDIVEVSDKGLMEIEFPDGAALAMGPGTQMLAVAASHGRSAAGDYYVMRGAVKVSRVTKSTIFRLVTPDFTLQPVEGAVVMVLGAAEGSVFIEGGEARLDEPASKAAGALSLRLKNGQFYTRKTGQKGVIGPRPSEPFIAALPRLFLDPLPSRLARYKERDIAPKSVDEASYEEVEPWLKAPPDIRRPLMPRFRPRASDPEFRKALVANLRYHPEWDPVLFPEKYKPKQPAPGAPGVPATAGSGPAR